MKAKQRILKGVLDVKEQMWPINLWLSFNTSWPLVFCIDTHMCTISKGIGINQEKEICL